MLDLELETLDDLDESLHSFYEEKDGVFRLAVNGLDDAIAGKSTLQRERQARKQANERLAQIEQEREQERQEAIQREKEALEKEGKFQEALQLERQERAKEKAEREELATKMQTREIERDALSIAAEEGVDKSAIRLLTREIKDYIEHVDGENVYKINGQEVDRAELIDHIRKENPLIVKGSGMSGGGAKGSDNGRGASNSNAKRDQAIADAKKSGDLKALRKAHEIK